LYQSGLMNRTRLLSTDRLGDSVLVVEDDDFTREILVSLLESEGFTVVAAEDGRRALALLQIAPPALVLLDLNLPEIDGWQLRALMLADPVLSKVPCVIMTAGRDPSAYGVPAEMTLFKPLPEDQLVRIVAQYAPRFEMPESGGADDPILTETREVPVRQDRPGRVWHDSDPTPVPAPRRPAAWSSR